MPCFSASPARSTPGPLPYQRPNTPCDLAIGMGLDLLRAEHRGRREILVDRGQKFDPAFGEQLLGAPKLHVDAAERRAAIARDEAGGVEPGGAVAPGLFERDAHQRLRAGQEHPAAPFEVAVFEAIGGGAASEA